MTFPRLIPVYVALVVAGLVWGWTVPLVMLAILAVWYGLCRLVTWGESHVRERRQGVRR